MGQSNSEWGGFEIMRTERKKHFDKMTVNQAKVFGVSKERGRVLANLFSKEGKVFVCNYLNDKVIIKRVR